MRSIAQRLRFVVYTAGVLAVVATSACSTPEASSSSAPAGAAVAPATAPGGLTPFQLEHGIGPITSPVTLSGGINKTMATKGAKVFEEKCSACHKMAERYVGPALGDVTKRRTPAFVMNMALNPLEMVEKHPETKKLLGEYFVAMPNQNITKDEARDVLEHLRSQAN
jgi:cytochrome c551/c552